MRIDAVDLRMLRARRDRPKPAGELTPTGLILHLEGKLENPMNATWSHWKRRRWAEQWKERTFSALYALGWNYRTNWRPTSRSRVRFAARVWCLFDVDGLQAALKPVRDALVEAHLVLGDSPRDPVDWSYDQVIDRRRRGVTVTVERL